MSNLVRIPVCEIDGDILENRIEVQRARIDEVLATTQLVAHAIGNKQDAGVQTALSALQGARNSLYRVYEDLETVQLFADARPAKAQEVAHA